MCSIEEFIEYSKEDNKIDVKKTMSKLSFEVRRYQNKVKSYVEATYVDFLPCLNSNELFLEEGDKLIAELQSFVNNIEDNVKVSLEAASVELRDTFEHVQEMLVEIRVCTKILKIDELFYNIEESKCNRELLKTMDYIGKLKTLIYDPSDEIFNKLDCFANIKIKYHIEYEMLLQNLTQKFEQLVDFTEKPLQNTKLVTVKISKNDSELYDTIFALYNVKFNTRKLCNFLNNNIFEPIMVKPASIEMNDLNEHEQISLSYSVSDLNDDLKPNYRTVFKNIKCVFKFLSRLNISVNKNITLFSILSQPIKEKFLNTLINDCLTYSIPDTMNEMKESTIVPDIQEFHKYLIDIQFINETDNSLLKYAEKVGILFRKRFNAKIVDNAVEIMRQDLHDMILVVEDVGLQSESPNPTVFPRCMISRSTKELTVLMERVLQQSKKADEETRLRMLETISTILNRYIVEVPKVHEKLLINIPQQTALFHNNCMYLAYWVANYGEYEVEPLSVLVKNLQSLGSRYFLNQIKNQKRQQTNILKGFDLSVIESELSIKYRHMVEQCLRQLDLLKNVWQTVLPEIVYNKTLSSLVDDFCAELISKIFAVEDIPSSACNELVEIFSIIIKSIPGIFQDNFSIEVNVKSWTKLCQMKIILNASLGEIAEQWSEGKGPLTLSCTAEDIRHLIRALFQNTDRRANALASIY